MEAPLALLAALPSGEGMPELRGDPFSRDGYRVESATENEVVKLHSATGTRQRLA